MMDLNKIASDRSLTAAALNGRRSDRKEVPMALRAAEADEKPASACAPSIPRPPAPGSRPRFFRGAVGIVELGVAI
jgi:hypothetical protein